MNGEKEASLVDELLGSLEESLEERKVKKDRRVNPSSTPPAEERRSGVDRRDKQGE